MTWAPFSSGHGMGCSGGRECGYWQDGSKARQEGPDGSRKVFIWAAPLLEGSLLGSGMKWVVMIRMGVC